MANASDWWASESRGASSTRAEQVSSAVASAIWVGVCGDRPYPAKALEAAHLRALSRHGAHDVDEGLLLRSDIHRFFDAGLIAVEPVTMTVAVAPNIKIRYPNYSALEGISITNGPYDMALADHHQEATAAW
ncbi:HNH endonuclease [Nocardia gipuzkoensis]|uniref:HNH endonuclease n=1 Tax=Nocardia gipuzkoensis TaxID=2749991 RepID=UPI003EE04AD9